MELPEFHLEPSPAGDSGQTLAPEALLAFRKAARTDPREADYAYLLGSALAESGRHAEAVRELEDAIRLDRRQPAYHEVLGGCLWRLQRYQEARASFEEALRLAPGNARALNGLGLALLRLGRAKAAVAFLRRASAAEPADGGVQSNLAAALWETGRREEAVDAFAGAVRLSASPWLQANLGRALMAMGRLEEALACFDAGAREAATADLHFDRGDALFALGRDGEAEAAFAEGSRLDPQRAVARESVARARGEILVRKLREELDASPASTAWGFAHGVAGLLSAAVAAPLRLYRASRLAGAAWLLLLAVSAYLGWRLVPPYLDHLVLKDKMVEAARAPVDDDAHVLERLMHAVEERGMSSFITADAFRIETRPRWRVIECEYERAVPLLPGVERRQRYHVRIEQPYVKGDSRIR
jgi:tetratricopeptide (TPR) repeat protein